MEDRAEKLKKEIHAFNLKIDRLQKQLENMPVKARDELNKALADVKERRNELNRKVTSFIQAAENATEDIQVGSQLLRRDLDNAYQSAKADLEMAYKSVKERFSKSKAS